MKHRKWLKSAAAIICTASLAVSTFVAQFSAAPGDSIDEVPLAQPYVIHNYGTSDPRGDLWEGNQLFLKEDKNELVDATKAKWLEFDFYVDDLANLDKKDGEGRAGFVISLSSGEDKWNHRAMYWFQDELKQNGWNHIKIDLSQAPNGGYNGGETDFTKVFAMLIAVSETCKAGTIRAANVALTTDEAVAPAKPGNIVKDLKINAPEGKDNLDMLVVNSFAAYNNIGWNKFAPEDCASAKYVEMDLFVEDFAKFSVAKNGNEKPGVYFRLYSGETTPGDNDYSQEVNISDYVTNNGWNHAKIEIKEAVDLTHFCGFLTGPWESYDGKFAIANICLTKSPEVVAPAKPGSIVKDLKINAAGKDNLDMLVVDSFAAYNNIGWNKFAPEDCAAAKYVEMDLYVEDFAKFSVAKNGNEKPGVYFRLYSGETTPGDADFSQEVNISDYITHSGWNHAKILVKETVDLTHFCGFLTGPWESYDGQFGIANICLTQLPALTAPAKPENIVKEMKMEIVETLKLVAYHDFAVRRFEKEDLSKAAFVEVDLYVDDYAHFSTAKNGNDKVGIYLRLYSAEDEGEPAFDAELSLHTFITKDGWNHARVAIPTDKVDMTQFTGYAIGPWEPYDERIAVANVCLTKDADKTDLPQNVSFLVDEKGFSNSSWSGELVFKEYGGKTYDLTNSKFFEIDLYISESDFESYNANPQNIGFSLGSNEDKWKDRAVFQGKLNLKQPGWNHFKIRLDEQSYGEGSPDMSLIQKVLLYHEGLHKIDPVTIRFANICFTSGPKEIGPDKNATEKRPDKNAYYISDCESLVDAAGAWNSAGSFELDIANRTEGDSSVRMVFNNLYNSIRYNRNVGLDLSKADKLKFDLFISNEEVMNQFTNGFMVRLASNGNYRKNYAYMNLDKADLTAGWNTIEIPIAEMLKEGSVSLNNIDTFGLFSVDGTFGEQDELIVKLDNLRVSGQVVSLGGDSANNGQDDEQTPDTGVANYIVLAALLAVMGAAAVMIAVKKQNKA